MRPNALIALADGYASLENAPEVLRRVYIDENEYPTGEKDRLVKADTGSSYGFIHALYHPTFDSLQNEMGYYDVFLFDTNGNLVYSVFKETDYATNMIDGPSRKPIAPPPNSRLANLRSSWISRLTGQAQVILPPSSHGRSSTNRVIGLAYSPIRCLSRN